MLDAMLKEFGSSFPEFKRVLIDERDMYLTHSLRSAYQPIPNQFVEGGKLTITNFNKKFKIIYFLNDSILLRFCGRQSGGRNRIGSYGRHQRKLEQKF